jgi:hypothetical protein
MNAHDSLTRAWYCEYCCRTLRATQLSDGGVALTCPPCDLVVRLISPCEWALELTETQQAELRRLIERRNDETRARAASGTGV